MRANSTRPCLDVLVPDKKKTIVGTFEGRVVSVLRYDNNVTSTPESDVSPLQSNPKHFGDLP